MCVEVMSRWCSSLMTVSVCVGGAIERSSTTSTGYKERSSSKSFASAIGRERDRSPN